MHKLPRPLLPTWIFPYIPYLRLVPYALGLYSCANQGSLTGGPKDEKPPVIVSSEPANFTTHFKSKVIEISFDEYFALKDIAKQLVLSPPMAKKPEFKVKGKTLEITLKDSLLPDLTYAINFGDALVDLNEGNPIKNFQYVFSTGDRIDSLQVGGKVIQALDGKPAEDILVMLYNGTADSLPLKTIPLSISRTNKEGQFTVKNLASGSYKIFALKDGNTNYLFDQPTEAVAFLDSLITPSVIINAVTDTLKPANDTITQLVDPKSQLKDTLKLAKRLVKPATDSVNPEKDSAGAAIQKSKYRYIPDSLELRLFTEIRPNQYLAGADRLRRDQIRLKFNEKTDSLGFEFPGLPIDSVAVSLEWQGDADTLDLWIMNPSMAARDSLTAILVYPAYDSIEQRIAKTDTVKLRIRPVVKTATGAKKEFSVSASVEISKTLEFGRPVVLTTSLPYLKLDTSLIRLVSGKDSIALPVPYILIADTISGLVLNGSPVNQPHPRIIKLEASFLADSSYRLTLLPGTFTGISGQRSDSLDIRFKMKSKDLYGTIKIELPDLKEKGIVELMDSRNKVVATRLLDGPGTAVFELVAPGKYAARLVFDTNGNGHYDTGRYIRHIQPERVISFNKELNLKANWELSETWKW